MKFLSVDISNMFMLHLPLLCLPCRPIVAHCRFDPLPCQSLPSSLSHAVDPVPWAFSVPWSFSSFFSSHALWKLFGPKPCLALWRLSRAESYRQAFLFPSRVVPWKRFCHAQSCCQASLLSSQAVPYRCSPLPNLIRFESSLPLFVHQQVSTGLRVFFFLLLFLFFYHVIICCCRCLLDCGCCYFCRIVGL